LVARVAARRNGKWRMDLRYRPMVNIYKQKNANFKKMLTINLKAFLSNRKALVKFGKLSLALLAIFLLGFFFANYIMPASSTESVNGGIQGRWFAMNASYRSADWNMTDDFLTCGNTFNLTANVSCDPATDCNDTLVATANFSAVGGVGANETRSGLNITSVFGAGGYKIFVFNFTVNCTLFSDTAYGGFNITDIQSANITVNASLTGNRSANVSSWTSVLLVNMSSMKTCPNAGEFTLPPQVPLTNGTLVSISGCNSTCTGNDRAEINGSSLWNVCPPQFGGNTTNFTQVAYNGNFSSVNLIIDVPGVSRIHFIDGVNMSTQAYSQAIMEFAMKNVMMKGKVGINDTEWSGSATKPNLTVRANLTIYNVTQGLGISGKPQIIRSGFDGTSAATCPTSICSGIIWDGRNLSFIVSSFSSYTITDAINVTLSTPVNKTIITPWQNINFTYTPSWNSTVTMNNCSLWANFSGGWLNVSSNSTLLVNNVLNGIATNVSNITVDGPYAWNVECYDITGLGDTGAANFTVQVNPINVSLGVPEQSVSMLAGTINFTYTPIWNSSTNQIKNCTLWGNFTGSWGALKNSSNIGIANMSKITNNTANGILANISGTAPYLWNVRCYANNSFNNTYPTNKTLTIYDVNITLYTPADPTSMTAGYINLTYTPVWNSTTAIKNCTVYSNFSGSFANIAATNSTLVLNNTVNGIYIDTGSYTTVSSATPFSWSVRCHESVALGNLASSNRSIIVSPASTATTTSITGSGSSSSSTETKVTKTYISISAGIPKIMSESDLISTNSKLTEISITVKERVTDAQVTVEGLAVLPTTIGEAPGKVYDRISISTQNLVASNLDKVTITFKVAKSWITSNSIDPTKVYLYRYTTSWEKLTTAKSAEDSNYYYYQAQTPGFSYFAVSGETTAATTLPTTVATTVATTTVLISIPGLAAGDSRPLILGIVLIVEALLYFLLKKKIPKKHKLYWLITLLAVFFVTIFVLYGQPTTTGPPETTVPATTTIPTTVATTVPATTVAATTVPATTVATTTAPTTVSTATCSVACQNLNYTSGRCGVSCYVWEKKTDATCDLENQKCCCKN